MKKRIIQTRTAIDRNTPNDIQDYFEENMIIVNKDLLGISSGLTKVNQVQVTTGLELEIIEGAISDGKGNFKEIFIDKQVTAPSTDDSYILYASGGIIEDEPYAGKVLLDTATRQTQVQTLNKRSYDSFDPVILLSSVTPPTEYIQLATFDVISSGTAINNLTLNYSDFGNLAFNSLHEFSQSGRSGAYRLNEISGRVIDESSDTTWLKIEIDNTYQGKGIEIDVGTNALAKGIVLNGSNNNLLELNNGNISLNTITANGSIIFDDAVIVNNLTTAGANGFLVDSSVSILSGGSYVSSLSTPNAGRGFVSSLLSSTNTSIGFFSESNGGVGDIHYYANNGSNNDVSFFSDLENSSIGLNIVNFSGSSNTSTGIKINSDINFTIDDIDTGLEIANFTNNAIVITDVLLSGIREAIQINGTTGLTALDVNTCDIGITINNADRDGININTVGDDGIYIQTADGDGISINTVLGYGVYVEGYGNNAVRTINTGIDNDKTSFYALYDGASTNANSVGYLARESRVGFKFEKNYDSVGTPIGLSIFGTNGNLGTWTPASITGAELYGTSLAYTKTAHLINFTEIGIDIDNYNKAFMKAKVLTESDANNLWTNANAGEMILYNHVDGTSFTTSNRTTPDALTLNAGLKLAIFDGGSTAWRIMNP